MPFVACDVVLLLGLECLCTVSIASDVALSCRLRTGRRTGYFQSGKVVAGSPVDVAWEEDLERRCRRIREAAVTTATAGSLRTMMRDHRS